MKLGDRVIVFAEWSSFAHQRGTVTSVEPCVMVLLDGERLPLRFDDHVLVPEDESTRHVGGAE